MKKIWLLDPGHGGLNEKGEYVTPGKRSPVWVDGSQYFEGVGNRDIVKRIAEGALKRGITTSFIVDPTEQKDISLTARVDLANRLYKTHKNAVYLSIHSNGYVDGSANGWEVWTSVGQTSSDVLAGHLYGYAKNTWPKENMRKDMTDGDVDKESNFYVLKYTNCPSVLSENFFHTNENECKDILMTEKGRQAIADMHLEWMDFIDNHPTL